jgi:hypothetical protein
MLKNNYPTWVCNACGMKYGRWYYGGKYTGPVSHRATYHSGTCGVCKTTNIAVTEPRDFGHLVEFNIETET